MCRLLYGRRSFLTLSDAFHLSNKNDYFPYTDLAMAENSVIMYLILKEGNGQKQLAVVYRVVYLTCLKLCLFRVDKNATTVRLIKVRKYLSLELHIVSVNHASVFS